MTPEVQGALARFQPGPSGHLVRMRFVEDGFFHSLQQDPQDDTTRLVYADTLEDRGDEASLARAEFIRVQVELATLSPNLRPNVERMALLAARQAELLVQWQRVWLGDLAETLHGWTFRRGFVEAVQADTSAFLDHAADWFAEWPTLTVAKLTGAGNRMPELAASPWLAHLRGLDLSHNGIDSDALAYLTASRFLCLLQAMDLSGNPLGARGAELVANARCAEELRELHLARCQLYHHGLLALVAEHASGSRRWRRLDLSGNGLMRFSLARLVDSPLMQNLEALDLSDNPLRDHGASVLANSPAAAGLIDLGLCATETGDVEVTAIAHSPNLGRLRSLDLRGHHCFFQRDRQGQAEGGIADLARSPLLGQLRRLLLARTGPSNGWIAEVLSPIRAERPPQRQQHRWVENLLRGSRYLIPSQLVECDLEDLWWLGDTSNRERQPEFPDLVHYVLGEYPEFLDQLKPGQANVLRLRYGIDDTPKTIEEISACLSLPRERVRELEREALPQLMRLWRAQRSA